MDKKTLKNNDIAITGQKLGVVEEFLPDKQSTFVKDGQIYATKSGLIDIDSEKRKIKIKTLREEKRKIVKVGDVVIGTILFLRQYSVGMKFYTINRKIHFNSGNFGNVHVSQISDRYVEKIQEAFQITDIIRARVIKQKYNEYDLSTSEKNLGVIYADCVICGTPLVKISYNKLRCERCGNQESRKTANDYRNVDQPLRF
ncbi:MAG: exosome complex RNA-binding protein Csl4 [Candidatus Lokiarchaeota archaeon]|nr:exosome complex RNA-binding protein Csl4 [Candidatus Lokiarchaeota archaeon]